MTESFGGMRRTHSCGTLRAGHAGQTVTLMGWAARRRDHGGLIFVDLRDREGLTQLVFNPTLDPAAHAAAGHIRAEFVLAVEGIVERRPPGTVNAHLATGEIEVSVRRLRILNEAKPLPFPLDESQEAIEPLRLKYRYLDLRRPMMLGHLLLRDQVCRATRDYLHGQAFLEVETPLLTRSTPEGARDFLGAEPAHAGDLLRPAPVPPALQADLDGRWARALLPDRPLLPGRGSARGSPTRVHPDRHRDVLPRP